MKTTLDLDDRLLREAKRVAAEEGMTLARVIEDALRRALGEHRRVPRVTFDMPTVAGQSHPDIDIGDRNALDGRMKDRREHGGGPRTG